MEKLSRYILVLLGAFAVTTQAAPLSTPNTFTAGTPAVAAEVNANFAAVETAVNGNNAAINQLTVDTGTALTDILANLYVPFRVEISGGICNTALLPSANPTIVIDSDATSGSFVVNSILVKTSDIPTTGFYGLTLSYIRINGTRYDLATSNLTNNSGGTGALESFDILGTPVRLTTVLTDQTRGGSVPHQIVANSNGAQDVFVWMFCRSDITDLNINTISVSGWKRIGETISVTFLPGA